MIVSYRKVNIFAKNYQKNKKTSHPETQELRPKLSYIPDDATFCKTYNIEHTNVLHLNVGWK